MTGALIAAATLALAALVGGVALVIKRLLRDLDDALRWP